MTAEEQRLADDNMRAEISKLIAETAKINSENKFYPLVVGCGATLAIMAIAKLFL
ncbi:MAG: hypothetical protein AAGA76_04795 [Pseudomonadota bacterium]